MSVSKSLPPLLWLLALAFVVAPSCSRPRDPYAPPARPPPPYAAPSYAAPGQPTAPPAQPAPAPSGSSSAFPFPLPPLPSNLPIPGWPSAPAPSPSSDPPAPPSTQCPISETPLSWRAKAKPTAGSCPQQDGDLTIHSTAPDRATVVFKGERDPHASFDPAQCRVWNDNVVKPGGSGAYSLVVGADGSVSGTANARVTFVCVGEFDVTGTQK